MLSYDGKKIIPAPLLNINKIYQKTGDGSKVGVLYAITMTGTFLPFKGSPSGNYTDIDDSFWTLSDNPPDEPFDATAGADFDRILRKQEALKNLLSEDGKSLEWQPAGGQPVVKCNPRILDISFSEGQWADRSDYSIQLESDWISFVNHPSGEDSFGFDLIQSASEDWQFEEVDGFEGQSLVVVHTLNAVGILGYDENGIAIGPAWENAKAWIDDKTGTTIDQAIMSGAIGKIGWNGGSYTKSTSINETEGSYSATETWVLSSGTTFIEKNFSFTKDVIDGSFDVSYTGNIVGIKNEARLGSDASLTEAKNAIPTDAIAKMEAESQLNFLLEGNVLSDTPSTKNIAINKKEGTVSFLFNWKAGDNSTSTQSYEATLDFNNADNVYGIRLVGDIKGDGETKEQRLTNAKTAILTDAAALQLAKDLIGSSLPGGITFTETPLSRSLSFNENAGSIRVSSSWNSSNDVGPELTIQISFPRDLVAQISIPGRSAGPIIQDMQTKTGTTVTVTYNSQNNEFKPSDALVISKMNDAAEVDFGVGDAAGWLVEKDDESWNPNTNKYSRTRSYIVR